MLSILFLSCLAMGLLKFIIVFDEPLSHKQTPKRKRPDCLTAEPPRLDHCVWVSGTGYIRQCEYLNNSEPLFTFQLLVCLTLEDDVYP